MNGFYLVRPGFTGFYWVLLGSHWILLGNTGFYWVLLGSHWVTVGFHGFHGVSMLFSEFYWVLVEF